MKTAVLLALTVSAASLLISCGRKTTDNSRATSSLERSTELRLHSGERIDANVIQSLRIDCPRIAIVSTCGGDTSVTHISGDRLTLTGKVERSELRSVDVAVSDSVTHTSDRTSERVSNPIRRQSILYYIIAIAVLVAVIRLSSRGSCPRR